jgi:hypothetical protein
VRGKEIIACFAGAIFLIGSSIGCSEEQSELLYTRTLSQSVKVETTTNPTSVAPETADNSAPSSSTAAPPACDPNYSGCVPTYPPAIDCADIGYTVMVLGSDTQGLDDDNDGYACESHDSGYGEEGYDQYGYDQYGYDRYGYDENGYDQYGYDQYGYDRYGYNENGYNEKGYDRYGNDEYGNGDY